MEKNILPGVVDRKKEKATYETLLAESNKAIRVKYSEKEMAILRKYNLTRKDRCLRFQFSSGRVYGFNFHYDDDERLDDVPQNGGCRSESPCYPMSDKFETNLDAYEKLKKENDDSVNAKWRDYNALIKSAHYVEDLIDIFQPPNEFKDRLLGTKTALIAISPEVIDRIKADVKKAAKKAA